MVPAEDAPLFEAAETRYATSPLCLLDSLLYGKALQRRIGHGIHSIGRMESNALNLSLAVNFVEGTEATSLMPEPCVWIGFGLDYMKTVD